MASSIGEIRDLAYRLLARANVADGQKRYGDAEDMRSASRLILSAQSMAAIKDRIDLRLNDYLGEMKPNYDDSITGFNEAWDIVRKVFDDANAAEDYDSEAILAAGKRLLPHSMKQAKAVLMRFAGVNPAPAMTEEEIDRAYRQIYRANGSTLNRGAEVREVIASILRSKAAKAKAE